MTVNCQGLSAGLEEILESDDEARLVNLLRDQPTDLQIINSLVEECVESGASKCLIALIRGEVCNIHPTFNTGKLPRSGVTALAYVAHSCPDPQVINLMLTKCGGACLTNFGCTIGLVNGLPIHFALINLSVMEHLYFWSRGNSIIRLISLLCLWETKPILDSLRVLVDYTDSVNDIAWTILKNGGFKQFTTLLLIAREKVIAPFDTGLTIKHYITRELDSIPEDSKLNTEQEEYKCILIDARTLLALFEVTGDDLSSYCSSIQKSIPVEDMMNDISSLLIKNQVNVSEDDIDFSLDYKYYRNHGYSCSSYWKLVEPDDCNKVTANPFKHSLRQFTNLKPQKETPLQQRFYTTGACQARKMSKSIPRTSVCPLPRHFGSITLKIFNRVRFL